MTHSNADSTSREKLWNLARQCAWRALHEIAQATGGRTAPRQVFNDRPDLDVMVVDVEPLAGRHAAAQFKLAARRLTLDYARQAREDGRSWQEIGIALGLGGLEDSDITLADAAYSYASGTAALGQRPAFAWVCPACRCTVMDRGPQAGHPSDCEEGHAEGCIRLAFATATWDAAWEDR